jgi:hypothetical protein
MDRRVEASDASLDPRGRTPAWSMRTLYRLYEMWCQPILAREKISASHWIMLRILVEQGDLNQLELGQHAGIPATTMVNALLGRLLPDFHDAAHQSMAGVPGEDVAVFWRVLLKIEANLSDMLKLAVLLD